MNTPFKIDNSKKKSEIEASFKKLKKFFQKQVTVKGRLLISQPNEDPKEDQEMNTYGKTREELVQESLDMLNKNIKKDFNNNPLDEKHIRQAFLEMSSELKVVSEEHNVMPAEINTPFRNNEGDILFYVRVSIVDFPEEVEENI